MEIDAPIKRDASIAINTPQKKINFLAQTQDFFYTSRWKYACYRGEQKMGLTREMHIVTLIFFSVSQSLLPSLYRRYGILLLT